MRRVQNHYIGICYDKITDQSPQARDPPKYYLTSREVSFMSAKEYTGADNVLEKIAKYKDDFRVLQQRNCTKRL